MNVGVDEYRGNVEAPQTLGLQPFLLVGIDGFILIGLWPQYPNSKLYNLCLVRFLPLNSSFEVLLVSPLSVTDIFKLMGKQMKLDFNASDVQYHLYLMLINLQTDSSL